jgi:hypothetical protein
LELELELELELDDPFGGSPATTPMAAVVVFAILARLVGNADMCGGEDGEGEGEADGEGRLVGIIGVCLWLAGGLV